MYIILYNMCFLFFSGGKTLKLKIEGKKGLPVFNRNLTRLMGSCCHVKI